jgi:hypothetical protein
MPVCLTGGAAEEAHRGRTSTTSSSREELEMPATFKLSSSLGAGFVTSRDMSRRFFFSLKFFFSLQASLAKKIIT